MRGPLSYMSVWLIAFYFSLRAQAFETTYGTPKQCSPFDVSWTGRSGPPFRLLLLPFSASPHFFTIPPESYEASTATGNFSLTLALPAGTQFIATIDDGFGLSTGGVSKILTVEDSSDRACLPPVSVLPRFEVSPPKECEEQIIKWPTSIATVPSIRGFVPGGPAFSLDPPAPGAEDGTNRWTVKIPEGTQFAFMFEVPGAGAETSALLTSERGGDKACLAEGDFASSTSIPRATGTPVYGSGSMEGNPSWVPYDPAGYENCVQQCLVKHRDENTGSKSHKKARERMKRLHQ